MRRYIVFLICIFTIGACGFPGINMQAQPISTGAELSPAPSLEPIPTSLPTLQADMEIQELMLTSSSRWSSLQATYSVTIYPDERSEEKPEVTNHQLWVRLPTEFKVVWSSLEGEVERMRVSDGKVVKDSTGEEFKLPPSVNSEFNTPETASDTAAAHPLSEYLGTPVSDLIFPEGLARRGGEYRTAGKEILAGREVSIVEWVAEGNVIRDRFWVDLKTGIILRQLSYGMQNGTTPEKDIQASYISINPLFTNNIFNLSQVPEPTPTVAGLPPGTAMVETLPEALNIRRGPNTGYPIVATLKSGTKLVVVGKTEAEDWWKVDLGDGEFGWVFAAYVDFTGDKNKVPVENY